MTEILPSHPDYEEINHLQQLLAWLKNPHLLQGVEQDLPELELKALEEILLYELNLLLNSSDTFGDYL